MTWLLWRQHRAQTLAMALAVAAFAVAVVLTGVHMAHVYDASVRTCGGGGGCDLVGNIFSGYGAIVDTVHLTLAVPVLLGGAGAVLIAREAEQGTAGLAWTQTVTRRRWVLAKVATALGVALVTAAAVSALVTWWSGTPNAFYGNRFEGAQFDTQNLVPVALALFAVALGLAMGALWRRTLPALAATVGVYAAVRVLFVAYVRPHLLSAVTRLIPLVDDPKATRSLAVPSGSWNLKTALVDGSGHVFESGRIAAPRNCGADIRSPRCLAQAGYHLLVRYHPPSQYWSFQWIESGIFVGLALALAAVAVVYTLRHDA